MFFGLYFYTTHKTRLILVVINKYFMKSWKYIKTMLNTRFFFIRTSKPRRLELFLSFFWLKQYIHCLQGQNLSLVFL